MGGNSKPLRILVLCTGNSCRSQMAEAYLKHFGEGRFEVYSAGTEPHGVNPYAIRVMKEDGIDISGNESKSLDRFIDQSFDYVITVCDKAREVCPYFPGGGTRIHHSFEDPAEASGSEEEILNIFRKVRDEIKSWSRELSKEILEGKI